MNKTMRLVLLLSLSIICEYASACWYWTNDPVEYITCRIPTSGHKKETMPDLWHRTLLPNVDKEEITKLIFSDGYSIEQLRKLDVSHALRAHLTANGNELLEYVCIMRQVNSQREEMTDPWYYYYAGDPLSTKLNELANECISRLGTRYGDRYAVLAGRSLNTLKRYSEIDSIFLVHKFADKDMEAAFLKEYAGYLFKIGEYEEALKIYSEVGDIISTRWCLEKLGLYQNELSVIKLCADYESNYDIVVSKLSDYITQLENDGYSGFYNSSYAHKHFTDLAFLIGTAREKSSKADIYQPLWRYAEAMAHLINCNNFAQADSVLALIDTRKVSEDFGKSIRALRFITQSRLRPYDNDYIPWVASEAEWLIGQSDEERAQNKLDYFGDDYNSIMFSRENHYSELYFSDMLHKAADVIIAPRMIENGDSLAVLQLLDIVDYANLSDYEVRNFSPHGNASTCFAVECGADIVSDAIARSANPQTSLDHLWKKTGSIRHADRWADIAGTMLLAEGRYKEAIPYFNKVSDAFASTCNYDNKNPFSVVFRANPDCTDKEVWMKPQKYYKLWFAKEMANLEDIMSNEKLSAEQRAQAKLKYGVGMANSVFPCWSLTRYGIGWSVFSPWRNDSDVECKLDSRDVAHYFATYFFDFYYDDDDRFRISYNRLAELRVAGEKHIKDALPEIKDPEVMAAYLKSMGHYRTIKHHYADTSIGREMKSKCDTWDLY